jgi:DNA-binding transcriptional LysR family regulator
MMSVVRAGLAATLLPWAAVLGEEEGPPAHWLPITDFPLRRKLHLCMSRSAEMSRACLAVHETLRQLIHQQIASGLWQRTSHASG